MSGKNSKLLRKGPAQRYERNKRIWNATPRPERFVLRLFAQDRFEKRP